MLGEIGNELIVKVKNVPEFIADLIFTDRKVGVSVNRVYMSCFTQKERHPDGRIIQDIIAATSVGVLVDFDAVCGVFYKMEMEWSFQRYFRFLIFIVRCHHNLCLNADILQNSELTGRLVCTLSIIYHESRINFRTDYRTV